MTDYLIFMDAAGDISPETAAEGGLLFVPMEYTLGEDVHVCRGPQPADALERFYKGQRSGDMPHTSQISPYLYEEFFTPYFERGCSALYLSLSSGLSSTYQSACMAASALKERFPKQSLVPVDSLGATISMGLLADRALKNRKEGLSLEENRSDLVAIRKKQRTYFFVDNLDYLKRGGRVNSAYAFIGTALNVKPVLEIDLEGRLINIDKKRGSHMALREIVRRFSEEYDPSYPDPVYITHSDNEASARLLEEEVHKAFPELPVRSSILSPIIGCHTGPGLCGMSFLAK